MEKQLFKQLHFVRNRTIAALDATTERVADKIPAGHKNNIRWNFGHIFVSLDHLLYSYVGEEHALSDDYLQSFLFNTSPDTWGEHVPTLTELRRVLVEQEGRIKEVFTGRMDEQVKKPFKVGSVELTSVGEVLNFTIWHEGLHQGTITSLKRSLGVENLWKID